MNEKICSICGKKNPRQNQAFCKDLGCSGEMISPDVTDKFETSDKFLAYMIYAYLWVKWVITRS